MRIRCLGLNGYYRTRILARLLSTYVTPPLIVCASAAFGVTQYASFRRVYLLIQFVSHVLPPSSENACSDCAESGVIEKIVNRTQMPLPLNSP
jgi:hypothetical protein